MTLFCIWCLSPYVFVLMSHVHTFLWRYNGCIIKGSSQQDNTLKTRNSPNLIVGSKMQQSKNMKGVAYASRDILGKEIAQWWLCNLVRFCQQLSSTWFRRGSLVSSLQSLFRYTEKTLKWIDKVTKRRAPNINDNTAVGTGNKSKLHYENS